MRSRSAICFCRTSGHIASSTGADRTGTVVSSLAATDSGACPRDAGQWAAGEIDLRGHEATSIALRRTRFRCGAARRTANGNDLLVSGGEFHTCVYAGPMLTESLHLGRGKRCCGRVSRTRTSMCESVSQSAASSSRISDLSRICRRISFGFLPRTSTSAARPREL